MQFDTRVSVRWDETLETALTVLADEYATLEQLQTAIVDRRRGRPPIGKLALTRHQLTTAQVFRILEEQAITGELFGEIALRMRLLDKRTLYDLLQQQSIMTPELHDVLYANDVITAEQAVELYQKASRRLQPLGAVPNATL